MSPPQINTKLGGVNVTLLGKGTDAIPVVGGRPFMILGADITHPTPGSEEPSIAALVGSLDPSATRFACRINMQARNWRTGVLRQPASRLQLLHAGSAAPAEQYYWCLCFNLVSE